MGTRLTIWLRGLLAALISGAAGGIVNSFAAIGIAPEAFNFSGTIGLHHVLTMAGISALLTAIVGIAFYLKQSPLPGDSKS